MHLCTFSSRADQQSSLPLQCLHPSGLSALSGLATWAATSCAARSFANLQQTASWKTSPQLAPASHNQRRPIQDSGASPEPHGVTFSMAQCTAVGTVLGSLRRYHPVVWDLWLDRAKSVLKQSILCPILFCGPGWCQRRKTSVSSSSFVFDCARVVCCCGRPPAKSTRFPCTVGVAEVVT